MPDPADSAGTEPVSRKRVEQLVTMWNALIIDGASDAPMTQ